MADQTLEIVNESDEVIGTELRSVIHKNGLRHREVHVFFVTPDGNIVFQRRSASKDTYPNFLDATAGGHVEPGQSYIEAALMEAEEETGQKLSPSDLTELGKLDVHQPIHGGGNIVYRMVYAYPWSGNITDLHIEENDGAGFTTIPLSQITGMTEANPGELVPHLLSPTYQPIWQKITTL